MVDTTSIGASFFESALQVSLAWPVGEPIRDALMLYKIITISTMYVSYISAQTMSAGLS